jgi:hypothetical protein
MHIPMTHTHGLSFMNGNGLYGNGKWVYLALRICKEWCSGVLLGLHCWKCVCQYPFQRRCLEHNMFEGHSWYGMEEN